MGELLFHGIAVKPGKPTVLGRVDGKAVLGMPGYPTSCLSNCYMILAPMLRRMARLPPRHERIAEVPLAKRVVSTIGRVEFHTVRIVDGQAVPAYKESGAITSMAHADGYIEIPANVDLLEKGEPVRVTLFLPTHGFAVPGNRIRRTGSPRRGNPYRPAGCRPRPMVLIERANPTDRLDVERLIAAYLTSEGVEPRTGRITWAVGEGMRNRVGGVVLVAREKRAVVGVALAVYSPSAEEGRLLVLNDFFVD